MRVLLLPVHGTRSMLRCTTAFSAVFRIQFPKFCARGHFDIQTGRGLSGADFMALRGSGPAHSPGAPPLLSTQSSARDSVLGGATEGDQVHASDGRRL